MQRQPGVRLILLNETVSIKCNHRIAVRRGIKKEFLLLHRSMKLSKRLANCIIVSNDKEGK